MVSTKKNQKIKTKPVLHKDWLIRLAFVCLVAALIITPMFVLSTIYGDHCKQYMCGLDTIFVLPLGFIVFFVILILGIKKYVINSLDIAVLSSVTGFFLSISFIQALHVYKSPILKYLAYAIILLLLFIFTAYIISTFNKYGVKSKSIIFLMIFIIVICTLEQILIQFNG